jgi:ABC-2 type transport system ATP-binding protein
MDEAERCHALAYTCYGRMLAQGTAAELIAHAALASREVTGPPDALARLGQALRAGTGLRSVASFGAALHVSADSDAALDTAFAAAGDLARAPGVHVERVEPNLEDVFIALMQQADDNFAPGAPAPEKAKAGA